KKFTDEVAVMLDCRDALQMGDVCASVENPDYVYSWKPKTESDR
ncbi:homogentisate 1,2-dioxygenase, partial [Pseudidiomarina aestuarii]